MPGGMLPAGWGPADAFGRAIKTQRRQERREEIARSAQAIWAIAARDRFLALSTTPALAVGGSGGGGGKPLETVSTLPGALTPR
jgi:hypothetical protein